jgi:hypothetical protein
MEKHDRAAAMTVAGDVHRARTDRDAEEIGVDGKRW